MHKRISFIVPCYKVEKYIEACVHSIFSSGVAVEDMDVICINDASPDGTLEKLQLLHTSYPSLQIINLEKNKGLSFVRNIGLSRAQGAYIWYVDSDDTILPNQLPYMLSMAEAGNLDVLCFNYNDLDNMGRTFREYRVFTDSEIMDGIGFVKKMFGEKLSNHLGYVWRFLYKREYLLSKSIFFPEFQLWEDTEYVPRALLMANRVQSTRNVAYEYWHHSTSITVVYTRFRSGTLVYERTFFAGENLIKLSKEVHDELIKERLIAIAQNDYFNHFLIPLCQSSKNERTIFFDLVSAQYSTVVKPLLPYIDLFHRLLLSQCIGRYIVEVIASIYILKKKMFDSWR